MKTFRDFAEGEMILVDKPQGWSSFDVVKKVRNAIRIKKIGHAGTLDPMATGLLILCTGKWTKRIDSFMAEEKEYEGSMLFGAETPSYDAESEVSRTYPTDELTPELIEQALPQFRGKIEQVPPIYSALKVNGKRAYELARAGKEVELKKREVEIREFELMNVAIPLADFRVVCSKGTYIRSLVHDLGKSVNNGAYMTRLVRTRIGEYSLKDAWQLEPLIEAIKAQQIQE